MQKTCKQFIVFDAGPVVKPSFPYLGKVYDPTEKDPFGLLEIRNPYTWRNHTMEETCKDPNFCLHMDDGKPNLRENDKSGYYDQLWDCLGRDEGVCILSSVASMIITVFGCFSLKLGGMLAMITFLWGQIFKSLRHTYR